MTFDDFVAERLDSLLRYATVLCYDPHLAKDIVQNVLLRAQQQWPRITSEVDSPSAYVKRMVTNEFLSWRRRRSTREVGASLQVLDELGSPTADLTYRYDEREAMMAKLATLPRRQRAALVLRYYQGYDDAQIAAELDCRPGTVRSLISRGLSTLRIRSHSMPPSMVKEKS
ncbi:RNA polymerase sigma-70 factor (sigma-E family) [Kibdelosporangium banguiense]|uniref:RNA polymerase sigma-70 factor (Sigma-E family) n=1 Tax=Kibdelosporangium banguiense TaxID=1365924 RepID=A0ABS4TDP9_9PSEU|nr:SigE family RNA polymerase sigma factor [Kibdelosporangium banguiense]MBP2322119.1 RNA polymerase sigma-70 factor (sigma-E family) [Kibdelosporangium banguiense]